MKKYILLIVSTLFIFNLSSYGQGATYTGAYTSSAPISLSGKSNQTINGLEIQNSKGHCIQLTNCSNITIQNCKLGPALLEGVSLSNCTNIKITNCTFDGVETGVYALSSSGVNITYNDCSNVQGPMPKGQMVQFDKVFGAGNSISYNVSENILGKSSPEDVISMYQTSGTAASPILVIGNWIRGGGPSQSGGGIMVADGGGAYVQVKDNILVNPGQYGIALASGHHISVKNNKIFGEKQSFTNIGLYAWNQSNTECHTDTIMNNEINFKNSSGTVNNWWKEGAFGDVYGWSTNTYNPNLNASILPTKIIGRARSVTTETVTPTINNEGSQINIYPNPVIDHMMIETPTELEDGKMTIYNIKGQRIIEQAINKRTTEINTENLDRGVYIVQITAKNKQIENKKIIIGRN